MLEIQSLNEISEKINVLLAKKEFAVFDITNKNGNYYLSRMQKGIYSETSMLLIPKTEQLLYQTLYEWLLAEYKEDIKFGYSHGHAGEYNYHFEIENNFILRLLGETEEDKKWIYERINLGRKSI